MTVTNAVKYGALRERRGRVDIKWRARKSTAAMMLPFEWAESNGPPVNGAFKEGFGTGFIRRSVEYELNGKVDIELQPSGFRCGFCFERTQPARQPVWGWEARGMSNRPNNSSPAHHCVCWLWKTTS